MLTNYDQCYQAHIGYWAIDESWLRQALWHVQAGVWKSRTLEPTLEAYSLRIAAEHQAHFTALAPGVTRQEGKLYSQVGEVALVRIVDQMSKAPGSFGGTSTILTRRALRQALADEDITGVLLAIDSPGGMVAGTMELADDVAAAARQKPVRAYLEDLAASAAYWVASQAQTVTASRITTVGSIGVVMELIDSSGAAKEQGLAIRMISTGPYKGLGAPGTPITAELVAEVDRLVQGMGREFFQAVRRGRRLTQEQLARVSTGELWLAGEAQALGLIDGIETFEAALDGMAEMKRKRRTPSSGALDATRQRLAALRSRIGGDQGGGQ